MERNVVRFTKTGQVVPAISMEGLGVTVEVLRDEVRLQQLATRAATSSRGFASAGPIRCQISRESAKYLKEQRDPANSSRGTYR